MSASSSKNNRFLVPEYNLFLISVFASGMALFMLFRILLLFLNFSQLEGAPFGVVMYGVFNRGSLYDASVNSYILALPFVLLSVSYFLNIRKKWFYTIIIVLISVFYLVALAFVCSDIPYYAYFNSRLTRSILNWSDELWLSLYARFSVPTYYPYVFLFLAVAVAFIYWLRFIARRTILNQTENRSGVLPHIIFFLVVSFFIALGMRGDYKPSKMPLSIADSYFSDYSLPNQIGLNPVYSFFSSFMYSNVDLHDDIKFLEKTKEYLRINSAYNSPVARDVAFEPQPPRTNVVLFIVESLSAYKFKRYGYKDNIMPYLDSLMDSSAVFDNVYTSGIHTYDGIYSSLFAMPSGLNYKAMTYPLTAGQKHSGISNVLKKNGYAPVFFCSGNKRFDNMNGFLMNNDFDYVFSQDDYPQEYNFTEWGVPDHVMFDYSIEKFNKFSNEGKPFFAAFMTISTHESVELPKWVEYKTWGEDSYDHRYQYFDWSVSRFFNAAKNTKWFSNTIFVFIADHGQNFDQTYDMSLSYNHTPMIFYAPSLIQPSRFTKPGLQIDLFPTLMGFLKIPYVNNTLGVDLRKDGRKYAYFCTDNKIGCVNDSLFLVIRNDGPGSLYKYRNKDVANYYSQFPQLVEDMKNYAVSMLKTSYWLGEHNLLSLPDNEY